MRPKASESEGHQLELGAVLLESFINMKDELILLGKAIDWKHFDKKFGESFHERQGRPGLPTRLMVGLTYLKYLHNLSDEKVRKLFLHDPYWQYFCGYVCFQKKAPLEASSLTRFRERLGEQGAKELLKQTIEVAKRAGLLKKTALKKVIVDTTVQEKNISYPTDSKLINKAREQLVNEAKKEGISLRQSYKIKGKKEAAQSARYFHAKQYRRGKAHKRYKFGNKVSFSVTGKKNWIIGAKALFGNPFDGKTLKEAIKQTEKITGQEIKRIGVDRGYRGKAHHPTGKETLIAGRKAKDQEMKRFLKRRSSIEPVIGHMKQEHRLGRNYLGGIEGDKFNPILAASAFNMQKLLRSFAASFLYWFRKRSFFCFSLS